MMGTPVPATATWAIRRRVIDTAGPGKPYFVRVAAYTNQPEIVSNDGRRAMDILHEHHIDFIFADSTAVMLAVPSERAAEALRLLATAVETEHLRLNLIQWNVAGDWGVPVKPEAILKPQP